MRKPTNFVSYVFLLLFKAKLLLVLSVSDRSCHLNKTMGNEERQMQRRLLKVEYNGKNLATALDYAHVHRSIVYVTSINKL